MCESCGLRVYGSKDIKKPSVQPPLSVGTTAWTAPASSPDPGTLGSTPMCRLLGCRLREKIQEISLGRFSPEPRDSRSVATAPLIHPLTPLLFVKCPQELLYYYEQFFGGVEIVAKLSRSFISSQNKGFFFSKTLQRLKLKLNQNGAKEDKFSRRAF